MYKKIYIKKIMKKKLVTKRRQRVELWSRVKNNKNQPVHMRKNVMHDMCR